MGCGNGIVDDSFTFTNERNVVGSDAADGTGAPPTLTNAVSTRIAMLTRNKHQEDRTMTGTHSLRIISANLRFFVKDDS